MKKFVPIIIIFALICVVVLVLFINKSKSGTGIGSNTAVSGLAEDDPSAVEITDEFIIELEENQAAGGF